MLSLGLIAAVAVSFWLRERVKEQPSMVVVALPRVPSYRPAWQAFDELQQQNANLASVPAKGVAETLVAIRAKLAQLDKTSKADKGAEDELTAELRALLTDDNAPEITQALSPDELNSRFGLTALQHWLKVDVLAAADWIAARLSPIDEQAWAVVNRLIEDEAMLESYCARLSDSAWRQMLLKQAVLRLTGQTPQAALRLVQEINSSDAQRELMQVAACGWIIRNPGPAFDWIARMPDSLLREQLVCAGVKTYSSIDPVASISRLITYIPHPSEAAEPMVEGTVRGVFGTWAESDPAQAAQAMTPFPSGDLRDSTVNIISRRWLERDPAAATAWIKTLPERDRIQAMFRSE